jgi:hypothetical protein
MFALSLLRSESGTEFEPGKDPKRSPGAHKIKKARLIGRILRLSYLSDKGLAGSATLLIATEYRNLRLSRDPVDKSASTHDHLNHLSL